MAASDPERFVREAIEASVGGHGLRITLFGGEIVEGVCTATEEDATGAALPVGMATPQEEAMLGPTKRTITIGDRTITAAEVVSLEVVS
jgi:hypothetical protein